MLIRRKSIEQAESSRRPARKPKFAPVTLSEQDGVRYLHFGTEWVQGAMRIRKPDWPELEYAQQMMAWMLFIEQPTAIAQLGLGTGALTKACYKMFAGADVTAVELNAAVIAVCDTMFKMPPADHRLRVLEMDALDFVDDSANAGRYDVLQCDLYDATARGPVLDTPEFYQSCRACLKDDGIMTVNLFGDHPSFNKNLKAMKFAFADVICLPEVHDGNVVALCFARKPQLDSTALAARAAAIVLATKLPAKAWLKGLLAGAQDAR